MDFKSYFNSLSNETVLVFVKMQQKDMSERMKTVYQRIKEITSAEIRRMSEEEVLNINNTFLSKVHHIFILDSFSGGSYEHLLTKKSVKIFGVPLLEATDVILTNNPIILNNVFQDITICTSNINSTEKRKLENLIKLMNGQFINELTTSVTHLITNSTKTIKYAEACNLNIPIYHTEFIYHIWNKCQKINDLPKANSTNYDVFKLPPLFDLKITVTGMSRDKRNEVSNMIEENGGKFEEIFKSNETDILVMDKSDPENTKFKLAVKYKIPVLDINWIINSIKSGYALCYDDFMYKRTKSLDSSSSSISFNESTTSVSLDDTKKETNNSKVESTEAPRKVLTEKTNDQFLTNYSVNDAKKLGHILDGYVFYFYNFPLEHYFKAGKLISACGGIRIKEIDHSITHVLCFDKENLEEFHAKTAEKDCHGSFVEYRWLVDCLKQGELICETDYIITVNSSVSQKIVPPSPMSRKAIHSLNVASVKSSEKKENGRIIKSHKKESSKGTSSKMLDFSNQPSIEANHKKLKQSTMVSRKRSLDGIELINKDETAKRRKVSD